MATLFNNLCSLGSFQNIAISIVLVITVASTILYTITIRYPANLPRIREDERAARFRMKTRLAYYTDAKNMFRETYEKYSKNGKTCLIPGLGFRDEVIIPNSSLPWLAAQPDKVLSIYEGMIETNQSKYNIGDSKYISDPWHAILVKRDMNSVLENLMVPLWDELKFALDSRFGIDTNEWTEFSLLGTMKRVVAQGSSRFTVGLPLCRNEQYLVDSSAHANLFVIGAGLIGGMPKILRPILGTIASIPIRYRTWKIKQAFKPLFQQRLQLLQQPKSEKDPQDHLQMMLRYAQVERPQELNINDMTVRLALANLGSYHQTTIAITNVIFNILGSDAEYNTISLLRDEATTVLAAHKNTWTKATASQMVKADSVCRETLRINAFGNRSLIRKVMVSDLRTEDGILLPKGAIISLLAHPAQCDGEVFQDPLKFVPFRFSSFREQSTTKAEQQLNGQSKSADRPVGNLSFVSTGPQHLSFGHGRHACPGRFLLDFELKMMIAYILMNYDIELAEEHHGKRPESEWMAEAIMPPSAGKVRVRRRKTSLS